MLEFNDYYSQVTNLLILVLQAALKSVNDADINHNPIIEAMVECWNLTIIILKSQISWF